jgi:hypothetical protein
MLTALALLLPVFLPAPAPVQQASRGPLDLLAVAPGDAVLVVSTDRFDAIRERAAQSAWGRFLKDERMAIGDLLDTMLEEADTAEWAQVNEVLLTVHGTALGFLAPLAGGKEFGGCVLVQPEQGLVPFLAFTDQLLEWVRTQGDVVISSQSYAGVDLDVFESQANGEVAVLFESQGVVGAAVAEKLDGALFVAHGVLDRINGRGTAPSFAAHKEFTAARGAGRIPALDVHLQLQELMTASGETWDEMDDGDGIAKKLGLDQVRWAHLKADIGAGEVLELSLSVHIPRATFLGKCFDLFGPLPVDLMKRMPGEGSGFSLGNYDLAGLWREIKTFCGEIDPETLAELEAGVDEASSAAGFDVEELIQAFDGRFGSFTMKVPAEEVPALGMLGLDEVPEAMQQGGGYFIGLRNAEVLRTAVDTLLADTGMVAAVTSETFEGSTLSSLDLGMMKVGWCVVADGLVLGTPTPLRTFLTQGSAAAGTSAADNPRFSGAVQSSAGASVLSVSDTALSVQGMLSMFQMIPMFGLGDYGNSDLGPLTSPPDPAMAKEFFKGTTVFTLRRNGDVFELFAGTR